MKYKFIFLLLFVCGLLNTNTYGQIKVFPNSRISFGTTLNPTYFGVDKLFITNKLAFANTATAITSSALIRGNNSYSTATTPEFTWFNDDLTGLYHPAIKKIGFSISGNERVLISQNAIKVNSVTDWAHTLYIHATTSNTVGYHMNYGGQDNFYVHASGWIYCQGTYIHSDESFKKDIHEIPDALDKVLSLKGVYYKLNYPDSMAVFNVPDNQMGLIAQQVEKVVPEVVKTMHDGTKAIAYQNLVALLIESVKEQQNQIEELKEKMNNSSNNSSGNFKSASFSSGIDANNNNGNKLYQNNPNPFSNKTSIRYALAKTAKEAKILIFNMQGNLIKTLPVINNGDGEITISSGELNPGMYMYSLIVDGKEIDTKKMILTR